METPANENSEMQSAVSSNVIDHNHDNLVSSLSNHGGMESKQEIAEEEVRSMLEIIAATGKFWLDWDKLKSMLSFHLKKILSEYPEAKLTPEQQYSSLGETYPELVKRLDDALLSFVGGPPFTLQRLSEILLDPRSTYSKLSKLALALEKNLLVTSTLTICADPYPPAPTVQIPNDQSKETEEPPQLQLQSDPEQNGVEPMLVDRDDEVATTESKPDTENNEMMIDMSAFEELVGRPVEDPPISSQTGES